MPLTKRSWPASYQYRYYEAVSSTMDTARELIDAGSYGPMWLRAGTQNAGRGRQGKPWQDPAGNLITTLILPSHDQSPQALSLISFVAGLAVHTLCQEILGPQAHVALKWPNDVLINKKKVSGILLESHAQRALVIGIGVNTAPNAPTSDVHAAFAPIALRQISSHLPDLDTLMTSLACAFHDWLTLYQAEGFVPIRAAWLAHAHIPEGPITARLPNENIVGQFEGLGMDGCLQLRTAKGVRHIAAGEIYW